MWTCGRRLRQIAIALIGDDDRSAGLGDEKIGAGDADVGGEEFFAQIVRASASSETGSAEIARCRQIRVRPKKVRCDLIAGEMHRRRDDVRRHLMAQLDDIFAEIGFDRRDAGRFERGH